MPHIDNRETTGEGAGERGRQYHTSAEGYIKVMRNGETGE